MKIDCIFESRLYAFRYKESTENEYRRLINLWNDASYLFDFYAKNLKYFEPPFFRYGFNEEDFMDAIENDLEILEPSLEEIENDESNTLDNYFIDLNTSKPNPVILSLQKKRFKHLRFYAIRIDANVFVITGGAIKITENMQQHPDTKKELTKLNYARQWLAHEGVKSSDSFLELINLRKNHDNQ